jgi:HlyD family secretion protein
MEQNRLALDNQLIQLDYDIQRLARRIERREQLADNGAITPEEYEDAVDQLEFLRKRREVTLQSQTIDEEMRSVQFKSLEATVDRLEFNLQVAQDKLLNLRVPAPVAGLLTSLDAEVGQSKGAGQRLGQIDDMDHFKVVAEVDEYYVTRVFAGQTATLEHGGQSHALHVDKVSPEVAGGRFEIHLTFVGRPPENLRRGQSLQMRLALGDTSDALLLPRGGFFQDTGGNWAFVLDESGSHADRRFIEIGRRNPEHLEVLDGLGAGERVITSAYTGFTNMDRIRFSD